MYEQAGGEGRALFHPFEHSKEPSRALSWQPAPELPPMPVAYAAHYEAALPSAAGPESCYLVLPRLRVALGCLSLGYQHAWRWL